MCSVLSLDCSVTDVPIGLEYVYISQRSQRGVFKQIVFYYHGENQYDPEIVALDRHTYLVERYGRGQIAHMTLR